MSVVYRVDCENTIKKDRQGLPLHKALVVNEEATTLNFAAKFKVQRGLNTSSTRQRVHFYKSRDALACASSLY